MKIELTSGIACGVVAEQLENLAQRLTTAAAQVRNGAFEQAHETVTVGGAVERVLENLKALKEG